MPTWASAHSSTVTRVAVVIGAAAVVTAARLTSSHSGAPEQPAPVASQPVRYLGVFEPDAPGSYAGVKQFAQAVGRSPNLVLYYRGWGQRFDRAFAETALGHGALTLVQLNPTHISLAKIAAGTYDSYLTSFADDVAGFRHPVIIGFAHEMNGYWYSWGYGHARPAAFIAAWRHIVTLFRNRGAGNVKWLWDVNSSSRKTGPVRNWWPGSRYVTWVGINGYYYLPGENFATIFRPVLAAIRQFTQDPVLIAETAVGPLAGQEHGIKDLFNGVRAGHFLGFVWFDRNSHGSIYQQNWRLEDSTAALTTFRAALRGGE